MMFADYGRRYEWKSRRKTRKDAKTRRKNAKEDVG